jgi:hypothetical protein
MVFHVSHRGVGRQALFWIPADDSALEGCLNETLEKDPKRSENRFAAAFDVDNLLYPINRSKRRPGSRATSRLSAPEGG